MNLHLFSMPGDGLQDVVETSRSYLEDRDNPTVAYLPFASLYAEKRLEHAERAFRDLARLETVNAKLMTQKQIEEVIRCASLVYIPAGNTFLLNQRLHASGFMPYLRRKIQTDLPLVGFSAGVIVCGPNVLTSKDMNTAATTFFESLNVSPFNFFAH